MKLFRTLLLTHGYGFVFWYVLAVQIGLPIPADPMLLIMGGMVGEQRYSFIFAMLASVAGVVLADIMWYELGRRRGRSIVRLLCRWSLEPDFCVRQTEDTFTRRGPKTLLIAKFVPGMSMVSVPLAGMIGMPRLQFILLDAAGAAIWSACYLLAGMIFHKQIELAINFISSFGRGATALLVSVFVLFFLYRYIQRRRFLHAFHVSRVTPDELRALLQAPTPPTIIDLRNQAAFASENEKIAGALVIHPEDLRTRAGEIPRDQEMILYCS